jgi:integrase
MERGMRVLSRQKVKKFFAISREMLMKLDQLRSPLLTPRDCEMEARVAASAGLGSFLLPQTTATEPICVKRDQRKYLTQSEINQLLLTARTNRQFGHRNWTMILLAFRHGFRVTELISLEWSQIDLQTGAIAISRLKNGIPSSHPMTGAELRALKRLRRVNPSLDLARTNPAG